MFNGGKRNHAGKASGLVVLLTGFYQNAGDALIASRAVAFARRSRPDLSFVEINRNVDPATVVDLDLVRHCVITGGPHWQVDMVPRLLPHVESFIAAGVPISSWGGGWRGSTEDALLRPGTRGLLDYVAAHGTSVGARDDFTVERLAQLGVQAQLTGCPAWLRGTPRRFCLYRRRLAVSASPKIGKSDAAFNALLSLTETARAARWRPVVVFQHPLSWYQKTANQDLNPLISRLRRDGVGIYDTRGELARLKRVIDSAAAHLGWRLHAHVYACTRNIPSLPVTDDERAPNMARTMRFPVARDHSDPLVLRFLEEPAKLGYEIAVQGLSERILQCRQSSERFLAEI